MKRITFLLALLAFSSLAISQPCMDAWHYRTPITIDNTSNQNPLVDFQYKIIIATDTLIQKGDMKADAGDLRFTNSAGIALPFWIVNNTLNTANTEIWINIDNIPPGSTIDIYMFYGNALANSVINGDATFLHYDNFDGTALDFGKWTFCGGASGGTIPVVAGGEVTFASSSGNYSHMIKSLQSFTDTITTEMFVNSFNNGPAMLGQITASDNGYGMALEDQAGVANMRLISTDATTGGGDSCLALQSQTPVNSVVAGGVQGLWSFTWAKPDKQLFSWPNGSEVRNSYLDSSYFNQSKKVVIGSFYNTSSISIDYVYTRKYSTLTPSYSLGNRTELVDIVNISSNTPICVGDTLKLFSPYFAGAVYNWVGPNGYTSTDQNPIIPISDFTHVGQYIATLSAPTGCSVVSDSLWVKLDSVPVAGTLLSDTTICFAQGQGTLELINTTGNIIYWESSNTFGGPWNQINDTNNSLDYNNLVANQYYRALVKSGACGVDTSNIVTISVDVPSDGGNIIGGNTDVCYGFNSGYLNAINFIGFIAKWQVSTDYGSSWADISTTNNQISYSNITDTTWYRMMVKSGVCDSRFSDTAMLFVNPLPQVNFSSDSVCLNSITNFSNLCSISNGTIDNYYWNFDDGTSSTLKTPKHTFANHGIYNVFLKAVSDKSCVDSVKINAVVHPNPVASFSQIDVCDTTTASFTNLSTIPTGNIEYNIWNYQDTVANDTTLNGSYLFPTYGDYDVDLKVVSDYGCSDSSTNNIRILQRAIVDFIPDSVCLGNSLSFINTSQTYSDSTVYDWNFGNGAHSSSDNPSYIYPADGTYKVVLQATTFGYCTNTKIDTVVIYPKPHASFTFSNECQYDTVNFINTSSIFSGIMTHFWNFGDSVTSTDTMASHYYQVPGNYFVSLNVISDFGCTDDTMLMTEVFPIPNANFVIGNICRDTLTPISNSSTIASGTYNSEWDFGNGDSSSIENPLYTFPLDGTFAIQLVTTSNHLCRDTMVKDITIFPIPQTNFITDTVCYGDSTTFINTTSINNGYINTYLWNLDDQSTSIDKDLTHLYAHDGTYNVKLRAISDKGCQKDTTIPVMVYAFPQIDYNFDNECVFDAVQFNNYSSINSGIQTYYWQFGDDSTTILQSPSHVYQRHGFFPVQLTATSDKGCVDSLTKIIEIYPLPLVDAGIDSVVSYGYKIDLMGVAPTAETVSWTPALTLDDNTSLITKARPLENTIYKLTVTDQYGCINSDDVLININIDYKLQVTNVITPNGDGKNDTWKIYNASSYDDIHIHIYDIWGVEVYKADNYQTEWDGTSTVNLDRLVEGTYYYTISFDDSDVIYKGAITILK